MSRHSLGLARLGYLLELLLGVPANLEEKKLERHRDWNPTPDKTL
jgi:hypothetical protein